MKERNEAMVEGGARAVIDYAYKALDKSCHAVISDFFNIDYKWISENVLILYFHNTSQ